MNGELHSWLEDLMDQTVIESVAGIPRFVICSRPSPPPFPQPRTTVDVLPCRMFPTYFSPSALGTLFQNVEGVSLYDSDGGYPNTAAEEPGMGW